MVNDPCVSLHVCRPCQDNEKGLCNINIETTIIFNFIINENIF